MSARSRIFAALTIALAGLLALAIPAASKNVFEDAWGVVTDPFKVKAGADGIYKSLLLAEKMQATFKKDADALIDKVRATYLDLERQTIKDIMDAEKEIVADVNNVITKAECAAINVQNELKDKFSASLNNLATTNPSLKLLGLITVVDVQLKRVEITEPAELYYATRDALHDDMNSRLKYRGATSVYGYEVYAMYQQLSRMASVTRCYYGNSVTSQRQFVEEAASMELSMLPWLHGVNAYR